MANQHSIRNYRPILAIATDYLVVAVSIVLSISLANPIAYLIAILIIATRQVALFDLLHSAVHYTLFSKRSWNDAFDFLYALPIFETTYSYRPAHFQHHKEFTKKDPTRFDYLYNDILSPNMNRFQRVWALFIRSLLGYWTIITILDLRFLFEDKRSALKITSFWLALIVITYTTHTLLLLLLYWFVPLFWIQPMLLMCAEVSDHFQAKDDYRNQIGAFYALFLKGHETYHGLHHRFPTVPYYDLRSLSNELENHGDTMETTKGIVSFLRIVFS